MLQDETNCEAWQVWPATGDVYQSEIIGTALYLYISKGHGWKYGKRGSEWVQATWSKERNLLDSARCLVSIDSPESVIPTFFFVRQSGY